MSEDYQYLFKIVLIGDSGVGKSAFLSQYVDSTFLAEYEQTIGVEFESKVVEMDEGTVIQNQIWDTSGGPQFRGIQRTFCQNSTAALLFYKINDRSTFNSLQNWLDILKQGVLQQLTLIGTHKDLEEERQVSEKEGRAFAQSIGAHFYEISNKDKDTIDGIVSLQSYNILRLINQKKINPLQPIYGIKLSREMEEQFMKEFEHKASQLTPQHTSQVQPPKSPTTSPIRKNILKSPKQNIEYQTKPQNVNNNVVYYMILPIILGSLLLIIYKNIF